MMDHFNLDYELLSFDFDVVIEGVNCRMSMPSLLKLQSLELKKTKIQDIFKLTVELFWCVIICSFSKIVICTAQGSCQRDLLKCILSVSNRHIFLLEALNVLYRSILNALIFPHKVLTATWFYRLVFVTSEEEFYVPCNVIANASLQWKTKHLSMVEIGRE